MYGQYNNIKISGISAAVPEKVVDNMQFAKKIGGHRAKRQLMLTGIKQRHVMAPGQTASDLSCVCADRLFEKLKWDRNEIRVIVNVTQTPDVQTPSTAMIIQKRLNIGIDCLAFDVNLGCSGYVSGLQIVSALLQNTGGKGLLLVGDGRFYEIPDTPDTDSLLFGDGASATALELEEGNQLLYSQKTDGARYAMLTCLLDGRKITDGNGILLFSLNEVSQEIKEFKTHFNINENDIDFYILHQAQKMIVDGVVNECNIPSEKALISYDEYGNTYGTTLPITICRNRGLLQKKKRARLFLSGFGVGLAWANAFIDVNTECIFPVETSSYCYNDL